MPLFECKFCIFNFQTRAERDEHIKRHLSWRSCSTCDKTIIQIGDDWYEVTLHVDTELGNVKLEENEFDLWNQDSETKLHDIIEKEDATINDDADFDDNDDAFASPISTEAVNETKMAEGRLIAEQNTAMEKGERDNNGFTNENFVIATSGLQSPEEGSSNKRKTDRASDGNYNRKPRKIYKRKKFECDSCGKLYCVKKDLLRHLLKKVRVGQSNKHECELCEKYVYFKRKEFLLQHIVYHERVHFQCKLCTRVYRFEEAIKKHIEKIHHIKDGTSSPYEEVGGEQTKSNSNLACNVCQNFCTSFDELKAHQKRHEIPIEGNKKCDIASKICNICKKHYSNPYLLRKHMANMHKRLKDTCNTCDICEMKLGDHTKLQQHMRNVHRTASFECQTCGKRLFSKNSLMSHEKIHANIYDHICNHCGRGFRSKHNFVEHLNTHSEQRSYKCKTCGKAFKHYQTHRSHVLSHQKLPPNKCRRLDCDRRFSHMIEMKRHLLKDHGDTSVLVQCERCPKTYVDNKFLRKHMESHNRLA